MFQTVKVCVADCIWPVKVHGALLLLKDDSVSASGCNMNMCATKTHPGQLCLILQQLLSHPSLVAGGLCQLVVGMLKAVLMALHLQLQLSQLRPAGLHLAVTLSQAGAEGCNLAVPLSALQDSTMEGLWLYRLRLLGMMPRALFGHTRKKMQQSARICADMHLYSICFPSCSVMTCHQTC